MSYHLLLVLGLNSPRANLWFLKLKKLRLRKNKLLIGSDKISLALNPSIHLSLLLSLKGCMLTIRPQIDPSDRLRRWWSIQNVFLPIPIQSSATLEVKCPNIVEFSTSLLKYSQDSLLKSFNADNGRYMALPVGSGCTGAL